MLALPEPEEQSLAGHTRMEVPTRDVDVVWPDRRVRRAMGAAWSPRSQGAQQVGARVRSRTGRRTAPGARGLTRAAAPACPTQLAVCGPSSEVREGLARGTECA